MPAKDISRFLFQPQKRYSGVRMQQGRVILDSDWNEGARIEDEEDRRTRVDVICSSGTSNRGFLIGEVTPTVVTAPQTPGEEFPAQKDTYNFGWAGGSFYIGGLRFETGSGFEETFLEQADWLQIGADLANLPARPTPQELTNPDGSPRERLDLVYLRGWEQCVTAVEDSEIRERALGGPDSSVRVRRMRRVQVLPNVPEPCSAAFAELKSQLTNGSPELFDALNSELLSPTRLTVTFDPDGAAQDLCAPRVRGGFLGADNQAIRVQVREAGRFIWGFDNASPLYRVQALPLNGQLVKITFLTLPRDQAAQPLKGQAVEILPWGALLPNLEKVADMQGHLATVATSFNPDDPDGPSITISTPVPAEWLAWLDDPAHADYLSPRDPEDGRKYFYLRLWTGGPAIDFTPGTPVVLQGTGLNVAFSEEGRAGDYWIIAARPNTPDVVVPWELADGAPPAGVRFFFAAMALIRWSVKREGSDSTVIATVEDCRRKFRPLCETRGCCTVTVGDGLSSHGDFDSIEAAIAALPRSGGEVCVLPGLHQANAIVRGRRNIIIKGCGTASRVIPRAGTRSAAVFHVIDSDSITLSEMALATLGGSAVLLQGTTQADVRDNRILAFREAVKVDGGSQIHICRNQIRILDRSGGAEGVLILAEGGVIERNDIGVVPAGRLPLPPRDGPGVADPGNPADPCADPERVYGNRRFLLAFVDTMFVAPLEPGVAARQNALGGIRIAAGSENITILRNTITAGSGNGITLGGTVAETPLPDDGEPEHVIEITGDAIQGFAKQNGNNVAGIAFAFTGEDGRILTAVSNSGGFFFVRAVPGKYAAAITTPGRKIKGITVDDSDDVGRFHMIEVAVVDEREEPSAFLREIRIEANEISEMGLSGIGFPRVEVPRILIGRASAATRSRLAPAQALAELGNPVLGLDIHANHIHDCLRNPFDEVLRAESRQRGLGGISLGICGFVSIRDNRIENNGPSHVNPACGIFIALGIVVSIDGNRIRENGQLDPNAGMEIGIRGGIIASVATALSLYALRCHGNAIHQPAGHALSLSTLGPVSACNNRLEAERQHSEFVATPGAVYIQGLADLPDILNGPTLFSGNQSRLGLLNESRIVQLIATPGDIGYDGNQSVSQARGPRVVFNSLLLGQTIRATSSRFQEAPGGPEDLRISLISQVGNQMNNTSGNQGDHCIFAQGAAGANIIDSPNQVLDNRLCRQLAGALKPVLQRFAVTPQV